MSVLQKKLLIFVTSASFIGAAIYLLFVVFSPELIERITTTVENGTVRQIVSVSGIVSAEDTATLSFPKGGIVESVFVRKGDVVATGTIIAALTSTAEEAERIDALANLKKAQADLAELKAGNTKETLNVSNETIGLKETILKNTETQQAGIVAAKKKALLSSGLSAYTKDTSESAAAPVISGTYSCSSEGQYEIEIFRSNTDSGYSFYLSGLESGTYAVSFDQPVSFGNCGLRAIFFTNSSYSGSKWLIDIPNKKSADYTTNKNAYDLAVDEADNAIQLAKQELILAKATANDGNAIARPEAITRAEAAVEQAQAGLIKINSRLADQTLRAPFSGTITSIDILPGEIVSSEPVATLLSPGRFELIARIPEIDIGKLRIGQQAEIIFDTNSAELILAKIDFLSPSATTIDGVAYFDARLVLDEKPTWLRSGLNADVDIIIESRENSARLPARFISKQADGTYTVLQETGTTTIKVLFAGNDGYTAVSGLRVGEEVIAP